MATSTSFNDVAFSDLFPVHPEPYMQQPYQISTSENAEAGAAESVLTYKSSTIDLAWYPTMERLTHRWVFKGEFDPAESFVQGSHTEVEGGNFTLEIKVDVTTPNELTGDGNPRPVRLSIQPDSSPSAATAGPTSIRDWVSRGKTSLIEPPPTIERKTYPDSEWIKMQMSFPYRTVLVGSDGSQTTFSAMVQQGEQPAVSVQAEVQLEATLEWFELIPAADL